MSRHGLSWLIVLLLAITGYTVAVIRVGENASHGAQVAAQKAAGAVTKRITGAIIDSQTASCYASTKRTVQQLHFDWTVYSGNLASSQTSGAGPAQMQLRYREALVLLSQMEAIAAVHLDVSAATKLPDPLSVIVTHTGFHCSTAYQIPRPPKSR